MTFYDDNGYLDFRRIRDIGVPFVLCCGGRGSGKTYGALRTSVEDGIKFIYMRRKQVQLDIINKPDFSPIKPVCRDTGLQITMRSVAKGLAGFVPYELDEETGKEIITGPPLGYTVALSTVANLRGFDASDVDLLIYDEFIPEQSEMPIPHEADALFNCYETLNRNKELEGRRPLQLVCLANTNYQAGPLLVHLGLVNKLDQMRKAGRELYLDKKRGLALIVLRDSPISAAKADTALYQLTAGTDFAAMALSNEFAYDDRTGIRSRPLIEYDPLFAVGPLTVYTHKSEQRVYVSPHRRGSPPVYDTDETSLLRMRQTYYYLWDAQIAGRLEYEDYNTKILLTKYMGW